MSFEILCVTMNQKNFSKINEMNINSDVIFANQSNFTSYDEISLNGHKAKMITTTTKGVGINRNIALMYANTDICLFADDDVVYYDNMESVVVREFEMHPDADIIIFNYDTDGNSRIQKNYYKTRRYLPWQKMPWGGCRIAARLSSIKKANLNFTSLFGGGCIFPSGEDSMWLHDAKKKGLNFYVSKEVIGKISFAQSSWFSGYNEKYYYAKGAYYQAVHSKTFYIWALYFIFRTFRFCKMTIRERFKWILYGKKGYKNLLTYEDYVKSEK